MFPYKEQILHEIEEKKRLKEEEFARKRDESRKTKDALAEAQRAAVANDVEAEEQLSDLTDEELMDEDDEKDSSNPMSALLASAQARADEYGGVTLDAGDDEDMDDDFSEPDVHHNLALPSGSSSLQSSRTTYSKIYKDVLQKSDIVLYLLDARDPNGTRSQDIEREIVSAENQSKRLILILNKIDLVPPTVLKGWLTYLRRYFPTLPLRASSPAPNAKTFDHKALTVRGTSETLLRALKSYAQSSQLKRSTSVGILGYPNVGKSSVINALTSCLGSSRAASTPCPAGAEAGVTTAMREVKLDGRLKLLDSPGILFPSSSDLATSLRPPNLSEKQARQAHLTLLAAIPPSAIDDPVAAVTLLLHRQARSSTMLDSLMDCYGIVASTLRAEDGDITTDFLVQVARKRGRLGKGGVPNLNAAAMGVLADWRDGRIRGWTEPPKDGEVMTEKGGNVVAASSQSKEIVQGWSKEFRLEGLWGDDGDDRSQGEAMEQ